MRVIDMGKGCYLVAMVYRYEYLYTKEQLKYKYHFAVSLQCYTVARAYLHAIYGIKEPFYEYVRSRGEILAFKYPSLKI